MATLIDKYSIEKMIDRYQKELDQLFVEQESLKVKSRPFKKLKAKGGIKVPDPNKFIWDASKRGLNPLELINGQVVKTMGLSKDNYGLAPGPTMPTAEPSFWDKASAKFENTDWGNVGNTATQLASPVYNIMKGLSKPVKTQPKYNPYNDYIRSLMRDRRFNINPLLNQNLVGQAVTNRNITNVARSSGALLGNLGAAQNYRMADDMSAWAQKNNMDNEYLAQEAQMNYGLGRDISQMAWETQISNQQARAARNQFMGQGLLDLGNFAQVQQRMGNERLRDEQLLKIYPDMFKSMINFMPGMQDILNQYKINVT